MCGIAGIIDDRYIVGLPKQTHRGPDFESVYVNEHIELYHSRLAIIDTTPAGNQPMESSRYVLTYNGEIYNYKELGHYVYTNDDNGGFKMPGDARVLIDHIERFGLTNTLNNLNGMFAFGLYDKIYKKLHLAVDRFAQKPLYYYHSGDTFAFASSPAALLHLKDKWKLSEQGLQSYFMLGSAMGSVWEGIEKVDGSECVTYDLEKKTIVKERYWEPKFQENTNGIEDLILDSIQKVKVSDVPVFIFLSGGIDSTLVSSQCQGMGAIHLESPELPYAEQVAKRFDLNFHTVSPTEVDALEAIKDYSLKCGEPSMAGIIPWITAREASKLCKVAISANGADELFFGYDRTQEDVTIQQARHIFRNPDPATTKSVGTPIIDERLSQGRWFELQTYIKHDLNKTLDFGSMAHSLEVRSPFLDHRLVEMALSIPQKDHGRKQILKNILKRYGFTDEFLNRPKKGFSLYYEPNGYDELKRKAYKWCRFNGLIKVNNPTPRDEEYLKASAAGFYGWYQVFKNKIDYPWM